MLRVVRHGACALSVSRKREREKKRKEIDVDARDARKRVILLCVQSDERSGFTQLVCGEC